jgi:hypothetical protein
MVLYGLDWLAEKMLGISWVAAQLVASREGLSSMQYTSNNDKSYIA